MKYCGRHDLAFCEKHLDQCLANCVLEEDQRAKFCAVCVGLLQKAIVAKAKTLADQADDLVRQHSRLQALAGEMLATVKLNFERGYLVAHNDEGKLNLEKILAQWAKQLAELQTPN